MDCVNQMRKLELQLRVGRSDGENGRICLTGRAEYIRPLDEQRRSRPVWKGKSSLEGFEGWCNVSGSRLEQES